MRSGRALRRAVQRRLTSQVLDVDGRVYDKATQTDAYPYITLGMSYWTDTSVECIEARTITLQIDVWSRSGTKGDQGFGKGEAEDVVDDVATALNGWMDQDALTAHPARVTMVRVMDDPNGCVHGVVQIEVMVEG